jgi:hypothetical protein
MVLRKKKKLLYLEKRRSLRIIESEVNVPRHVTKGNSYVQSIGLNTTTIRSCSMWKIVLVIALIAVVAFTVNREKPPAFDGTELDNHVDSLTERQDTIEELRDNVNFKVPEVEIDEDISISVDRWNAGGD